MLKEKLQNAYDGGAAAYAGVVYIWRKSSFLKFGGWTHGLRASRLVMYLEASALGSFRNNRSTLRAKCVNENMDLINKVFCLDFHYTSYDCI